MSNAQPIAPCLWFDTQAEEAARYYTGIFKNSKMGKISYYTEAGSGTHGKRAGTVLTASFELNGQPFTALNGGPQFKFNEAISLQIMCKDQEEIDYYWNKLGQGGDPDAEICGWLKDKFGVSWQVVPAAMADMMADPDTEKTSRVMDAVMQMKKLDIAQLQRAYDGETAGSQR